MPSPLNATPAPDRRAAWPWRGLTRSLQTWAPRLPGCCKLCHRWQAQGLCTDCLSRWHDPQVQRCVRCALPLPDPAAWRSPAFLAQPTRAGSSCERCEAQGHEFDRAIVAFDYALPWSPLVARLKFHDDAALARSLAQPLADAVRRRGDTVDLILPLPLSARRLQERGYNQAWLLSRALQHALGVPACHDVLHRVRHTHRLMRLDAEARREAIAGAFAISPGGARRVQGRRIALVDDVLTTGATLDEAARTLRQAGARGVSAWVLARTPAPERPGRDRSTEGGHSMARAHAPPTAP